MGGIWVRGGTGGRGADHDRAPTSEPLREQKVFDKFVCRRAGFPPSREKKKGEASLVVWGLRCSTWNTVALSTGLSTGVDNGVLRDGQGVAAGDPRDPQNSQGLL